MPAKDRSVTYQVDIRYHGQGLQLSVDFDLADLKKRGLDVIGDQFDEMHKQLFTFALESDKELVNLRAVAQGKEASIAATKLPDGGREAEPGARIGQSEVYMDGKDLSAALYDRSKLAAGNVIAGPAIVLEMDSTTVILPGHEGTVDAYGSILINPTA